MSEKLTLALYNVGDVTEWFYFLDGVRKEGSTNMLGAAPLLVMEFGLAKERAAWVLSLWMKTYSDSINVDRRARAVYFANGGT